MTRRAPRIAAAATLAAALIAVLVVVTGVTSDPYVVKAEFADAGQLVTGNVVEVGGRRVGEVTSLDVADNGLALVEMTLKDDSVRPLHQGTRAAIRSIGLSGVANRFVDLSPGPASAPRMADGSTIPMTRTRGIVDLDSLMNALDEKVRADIRSIVTDAATALTPTSAKQVNAGLEMLNPAVSRLTALGREITRDEQALRSVLEHTASVGTALSNRRDALGSGIRDAAGTLQAVASARDDLTASLDRAPGVLRDGTRTLARVREGTLPKVDPFLKAARPAIAPLGDVLDEIEPTLDDALPVMQKIREVIPQSKAALEPIPELEKAASPALASGSKALKDALPMVSGLRPYTPDLVAGLFLGFGGSGGGYYDANGHYARVQLMAGYGALPGLLPKPPADTLGGYRTGKNARCPGGASQPAQDGSNPWPAGAAGACNPGHDVGR